MRKFFKQAVLLASTVVGTFSATGAANAATASATATATIVQAITISQTTGLNFATIAPSTTGGNVTVNAADTRTACTGSQFCTGTVTSASFAVAGAPTFAYAITLPTAAVTLTRVSGTETMTAASFVHSAGATPALSATGAATFKVGATLAVAANQVAGVYNGTFPVAVDYN